MKGRVDIWTDGGHACAGNDKIPPNPHIIDQPDVIYGFNNFDGSKCIWLPEKIDFHRDKPCDSNETSIPRTVYGRTVSFGPDWRANAVVSIKIGSQTNLTDAEEAVICSVPTNNNVNTSAPIDTSAPPSSVTTDSSSTTHTSALGCPGIGAILAPLQQSKLVAPLPRRQS